MQHIRKFVSHKLLTKCKGNNKKLLKLFNLHF